MEATKSISNKRTLQNGITKEAYFDTQFKFQDFAEKTLCDRFLKWKHNTYIAYAAVNSNFEAFQPNGQALMLKNATLKNRFDELFPYSFIIVDKSFIDNNYLPKEYNGMKRYLYMVNEEVYNDLVKQQHKPRSIEHKSYPGIRIFQTYERLVEFIEERLNRQPIIIIGKEPWAKLRYLIDQLQITFSDELPSFENNDANKFPLDKFQNFMNFNTIQEVKHTVKTVLNEQTDNAVPSELPTLFSDYIKFSYSSSVLKKSEKAKQAETLKEEHFSYFTITRK